MHPQESTPFTNFCCRSLARTSVLLSEVDSDRHSARGSRAWPLAGWLWCARWRLGTRRARAASFAPDHVAWPLEQMRSLAARRANGHPRRARARGSRMGHIVSFFRARARQQIKISQNSGTPVPNCSKNGWPDCSTIYRILASRILQL